MFEAYNDFRNGLQGEVEPRDEAVDMQAVIELIQEVNTQRNAENLAKLQEYASNINYHFSVREKAREAFQSVLEEGRR